MGAAEPASTPVANLRVLQPVAAPLLLEQQRRRKAHVSLGLALADMLGLGFAIVLAAIVVSPTGIHGEDGAIGAVVTMLVWLGVASTLGHYDADARRRPNRSLGIGGMVVMLSAITWGIVMFTMIMPDVGTPSTPFLVAYTGFAVPLIWGIREATLALYRRTKALMQRVVILGAGDVGQLVARKIQNHPEYGFELMGLVDDAPRERRLDLAELKLLGSPSDLWEIVAENGVERVIVAFSSKETKETLATIRQLAANGIHIDIVPRLFEAIPPRSRLDEVEGITLVTAPATPGRRKGYRLGKRAFDLVVAGAMLLIAAPLFAFIAWRVRADSPGPIFFRQTRCGEGMREFTSRKFRTMRTGTSMTAHKDYIAASMSSTIAPESDGLFKLTQHDAITKSGAWLRKTSLDELPQLINVLRGDMSLVGPRPCIPYETEFFEAHHFERFSVPAGLTGLWQTAARAHVTFKEAPELDVAYARSCSFTFDLRLLLSTPGSILSRGNTR